MSDAIICNESLERNSIESDAFYTPRSRLSILSNVSRVSQEALSNGLRAFLCFTFGLSMLTPWNTWITATPFFKSRLAGSPFADNFNNFFSLGYMSVYVFSLTIFIIIQKTMNISYRIVIGYLLLIITFAMGAWMASTENIEPIAYFYASLVLVGISGFCSALLAGIFGLIASYPPIFTAAVTSGQGLGGAIPALSQLFIVLFPPSSSPLETRLRYSAFGGTEISGAIAYFLVSMVLCIIGLVAYLVLRYMEAPEPPDGYQSMMDEEEVDVDLNSPMVESVPDSTKLNVFSLIRMHFLSIFLTFFITLSLFPAITGAVLSTQPNASNAIFVTVHFLIYNLTDWLGKSIPAFVTLKISSSTLHQCALLRLAFIPIIFLCNVVLLDQHGTPLNRLMPLMFGDTAYYLVLFLFALSNGWLGTLLLMDAPSQLQSSPTNSSLASQKLVGDWMVFGLGLGLAMGSLSSFGFRALICGCNPFLTV